MNLLQRCNVKSVSYTEKIVEVISISTHAETNGGNLRLGHT